MISKMRIFTFFHLEVCRSKTPPCMNSLKITLVSFLRFYLDSEARPNETDTKICLLKLSSVFHPAIFYECVIRKYQRCLNFEKFF